MPVRVAFFLGFYDSVLKRIQRTFEKEMRAHSLICIRPAPAKAYPDLRSFRAGFFDKLAQGATDVLVLVAIVRSQDEEWLSRAVEAAIEEGRRRFGATVTTEYQRDARDDGWVADKLKAFAPTVPTLISSAQVRQKLSGQKVLCIREKSTGGFRSALEHAGFEPKVYEEHFTEHVAEASASSKGLGEKVRMHTFVMYAFERFGHSFGKCLDGHDGVLFKEGRAGACVASFKNWLLKPL